VVLLIAVPAEEVVLSIIVVLTVSRLYYRRVDTAVVVVKAVEEVMDLFLDDHP
jgi:hypothetical protein